MLIFCCYGIFWIAEKKIQARIKCNKWHQPLNVEMPLARTWPRYCGIPETRVCTITKNSLSLIPQTTFAFFTFDNADQAIQLEAKHFKATRRRLDNVYYVAQKIPLPCSRFYFAEILVKFVHLAQIMAQFCHSNMKRIRKVANGLLAISKQLKNLQSCYSG